MTMLPRKPITKPGEGKEHQKYLSEERYLEERYLISHGLKGPKRLEDESFEEYQVRREAENSLTKDYLAGVIIDHKYFDQQVVHHEQNPDPRNRPMDMGSSEESEE